MADKQAVEGESESTVRPSVFPPKERINYSGE